MDYLKNLRDSIQRKYSCDQTSSLHRLEDLIQESMVSSQAFFLPPVRSLSSAIFIHCILYPIR